MAGGTGQVMSAMSAGASHWTCESWIAYIFDRPVAQPEWWFGFEGPLPPEPAPAEALAYMTRLCTHADVALAPYSNAQVNQGFWYLIGSGASGLALALNNSAALLPEWTRCVRSFGPLFAALFAPRCSPHLGHLDEPGADPLNLVCYMWWDIFPLIGHPDMPAHADLDAACLDVMRQTLALDNDACRENALHGLGHWLPYYPAPVEQIIADFLARTPTLRPELLAYARRAQRGAVL